MTIPPPILLGISVLFIIIGVVSMPWLQEISLILIIIGAVVSIYAVAGLIGMAFRKKAPYLEADIKDTKHLPGVYLLVVGFFAFFAFFRVFSDQLPENLVAPLFFAGLGGLFILGIFAFVLAKKRWGKKSETSSEDSVLAPPSTGRMKQRYWAPIIVVGVALIYLGIIYINSRSTDVSEWMLFESEKDGFEVLFPSLPEEDVKIGFLQIEGTDEQHRYRTTVYSSRKPEQDRYYSVNVIEYPFNLGDVSDEDLLEKLLDNLVASASVNELKFSELTKFEDYSALDFLYSSYNLFHTCGKIIVAEQVLYRLSARYERQNCLAAKEYEEFIESFRLVASSWETYKNEEMGFELRYPAGFKVDEFENHAVIYKGEKLSVSINSPIDPYSESFAIAIYARGEDCGDCASFNLERVDIGGYYTQRAITNNPFTTYLWIYPNFGEPSQKVFRINYSYHSVDDKISENEKVLKQIFSTIRFVEL